MEQAADRGIPRSAPSSPEKNGGEAPSDALCHSVAPAELAETLRRSGYRATLAESNSGPQVHSAVQGLGFFVSFGNRLPGAPGQYLDFSFHCWFGIRGELPAAVVDEWNRGKRFARLFRQQQILVLTMDVLLVGGVGPNHLRAQCEIWDQLVRDLLQHLRRSGQVPPAAAPGAATAA